MKDFNLNLSFISIVRDKVQGALFRRESGLIRVEISPQFYNPRVRDSF